MSIPSADSLGSAAVIPNFAEHQVPLLPTAFTVRNAQSSALTVDNVCLHRFLDYDFQV